MGCRNNRISALVESCNNSPISLAGIQEIIIGNFDDMQSLTSEQLVVVDGGITTFDAAGKFSQFDLNIDAATALHADATLTVNTNITQWNHSVTIPIAKMSKASLKFISDAANARAVIGVKYIDRGEVRFMFFGMGTGLKASEGSMSSQMTEQQFATIVFSSQEAMLEATPALYLNMGTGDENQALWETLIAE